jgi:hypothetical protein
MHKGVQRSDKDVLKGASFFVSGFYFRHWSTTPIRPGKKQGYNFAKT